MGEIVILKIWNDTSCNHSIHLHGHHFCINSFEFGKTPKMVMRDKYLMQPGEKAELIFEANNPRLWLFHCHMLEHASSGMGGIINIKSYLYNYFSYIYSGCVNTFSVIKLSDVKRIKILK